MLHRFRQVQMAELGLVKPKQRRPYIVSDVKSLPAAEKWRTQVLREVSRKLTNIQDGMDTRDLDQFRPEFGAMLLLTVISLLRSE